MTARSYLVVLTTAWYLRSLYVRLGVKLLVDKAVLYAVVVWINIFQWHRARDGTVIGETVLGMVQCSHGVGRTLTFKTLPGLGFRV